jgi:hypothetical protein
MLGQEGIGVVSYRKRWIEADAGTDHKRWEDCEAKSLALQQSIDRKDAELRTAWTTIGEKDKQIAGMAEHIRTFMAVNRELTQTIGQNNASLIEKIPAAKPSEPLAVAIDPSSGPVPVHEVDPPAKGGGA